ncbi:MAG TPA: Lrp/AsnC family transcriptional regulator [Terriglobales bacterium]|nr:Lrp/AsnC family transcriptional regulator [Terriglobales bacterium]
MQDRLDRKAVRLLMRQGRASWAQVAEHLGLSAPAAAERVRRLEKQGVIRGYAALIRPESVGLLLNAFVMVTLERPQHRARFLRYIERLPEVSECHHIAGEDDYLLKVRCRNPAHLDEVINQKIKGVPGVTRTRTTIVLRTMKESVEVPLPE